MGNMPVPLPRVGGKKRLLPEIVPWLAKRLQGGKEYVEPFLGGGSVALALLDQEIVKPGNMLLADGDPRVAMFWQAVRDRTADMIKLVRTGRYCTDRWYWNKELLARKDVEKCDPVDVGIALWHNARWGYSAMAKRSMPTFNKRRFNPMWADCFEWAAGLLEGVRIEHWGWYTTLDECPNAVAFIDPPYWCTLKNKGYYHVNMTQVEHYQLAEILSYRESPWMLTYDDPLFMRVTMDETEGVERRDVEVRGGIGGKKRRREEVIYTRG